MKYAIVPASRYPVTIAKFILANTESPLNEDKKYASSLPQKSLKSK